MKFRNGTIIRSFIGYETFLIEQGKRRRITDPIWLSRLGQSESDVIIVSAKEFELHEQGEDLN